MAKKIIDIIPKHNIYLEPFFGSGTVFFQKVHVIQRCKW
ncbi:DNA adenine methylase [Clostridium sp. ZBS18]|nr:DNA adenine methylase [Clostridium sp. ZBS18]